MGAAPRCAQRQAALRLCATAVSTYASFGAPRPLYLFGGAFSYRAIELGRKNRAARTGTLILPAKEGIITLTCSTRWTPTRPPEPNASKSYRRFLALRHPRGADGAVLALRDGGGAVRALQYSQVRVTTFGIRLMAPASSTSP